MVPLRMNSQLVNFKVDTSAAVTAIPAGMGRLVGGLSPSCKLLRSAGNHRLRVTGEAEVTLSLRNRQIAETV